MSIPDRKLIITADDYGLCDSVNQAIEECLEAGTVRATCVMANMPAYTDAEALSRRFPKSSIGIHWNLTQGRPVLPCEKVRSLVNSNGVFFGPRELKRRWSNGHVELKEVGAELRAQFDRLIQLAARVDFWNTHQDSHMYPRLFQAVVQIGRELRIPAMRSHRRITVPRETSSLQYNLSHPQYWLKGRMIAWWSARAETLGTLMPGAKVHAPGYDGEAASIKQIIERIAWFKVRKPIEMVIHPATAVRQDLFGTLTESRLIEYQTFRNPKLADLLRQNDIELVGFDALGPQEVSSQRRTVSSKQ